MNPTKKNSYPLKHKLTVVYSMLGFIVILTILQLWLLTATMNAFLGGDEGVILPVFIASLACFALNGGLLWMLYRMDKA